MNIPFKTSQTQGVFVRLIDDAHTIQCKYQDQDTALVFLSEKLKREGIVVVQGEYQYIGQVGSADLSDTGITNEHTKPLNKDWAILVEG